jgi:hypothetical protein
MEIEVNQFCHEFCSQENLRWLLSYQIRNLQMCFDIFTDIENSKISQLYSKPFKGSDHRRPFSFKEIINVFEAR